MKILGVLLLLFGIFALIYGGITYNRTRTVVDVGAFKATATEKKTLPLSPIAGGVAVIAGTLLLVVSRKRS